MLKLNAINEDGVVEAVEWNREILREIEQRETGGEYDEEAGKLHRDQGCLLYALERPEAARGHFGEAARRLSRALVGRARPEPATHRSAWEAEQFLNIIATFGTAEDVARLEELQPWQCRAPERAGQEALAGYVAVLADHLLGRAVNEEALAAWRAECERAKAGKEERLFLASSIRGLLAVRAGNEEEMNFALARILAAHKREAQKGDLKLLAQGMVSFRALMLARLGAEAGLECRAVSEYLPLELLEGGGEG